MFTLSQEKIIQICLALAFLLNLFCWFYVRDVQSYWTNVPPAPDKKYASVFGLGDSSFAYRINGIVLQNLGDTGGRFTALNHYNYEALGKWFLVQDHLDPVSDFIPYLAAYYFGSVQDPEMLPPVLDYLTETGGRDYGNKWRWLAQGVFLARYQMKDLDRALHMAEILASTKNDNVPEWVRQMPAFVLTARGEEEAAYALFVEILKTRGKQLHPNEVNAMKAFICTRILDANAAKADPICETYE